MITRIALPLIGFLTGLLVVTMGGGGGGMYVAVLTVFFNVPPATAAATSLATIIPTTAMGAFSHYRAGNVNVRGGLIMLAGGAVGAVIGSIISGFIPAEIYTKLIGGLMLILTAQMLVSQLRRPKATDENGEKTKGRQSRILIALVYGFIGGTMAGLVGLSGTGPIIVGLNQLGCSVLEMVGTSVFVLVGISLTGFITHIGVGSVDWQLVGLLLIGTVTGAAIGPMVLKRLDKKKLEKVVGPCILIMLFSMSIILLVK